MNTRWLTAECLLYKSKYEKVGVLPIRIVKSNVSSVGPSSERKRIHQRRTDDTVMVYSHGRQ